MTLQVFLEESREQFEKIRQELVKAGHEPPEAEECVKFVFELSKFQHKLQYSLPMKLFWDLSENGTVFIMLKISIFNLKTLFQSSIWSNPKMDSHCSNIVLLIRNEIESEGFWRRPQIFISTDVALNEKDNLEKIVIKLGGFVAAKFNQNTTHVVSTGESICKDMKGHYRVEQIRNSKHQRHFCFEPVSADLWTDEKHTKKRMKDVEDNEPDCWNVSIQWLTDSEKYNEWMNEYDYSNETEAQEGSYDSFESESVVSSESMSEAYVDDEESKDKDGEYVFDGENDDEEDIGSGSEEDSLSGEDGLVVNELEDLEDDLEVIVEAKKGSAAFEWPIVIEISLDRKIPMKLKPVEFEPIKDGKLINLSACYSEPATISMPKHDQSEVFRELSTDENVAIEMLELIHGSVARDDFILLNDWTKAVRKLDPNCQITLAGFRKVVPDADIHLLSDIYEIMIRKYGEGITPRVKSDSPMLFDLNCGKISQRTYFKCTTCGKDCFKFRYRALKYEFYILCTNCFENGSFHTDLSSSEFVFERGFGVDTNDRKEIEWDNNAILELLNAIEINNDLKAMCEMLKKPRYEVIYNTITLPTSLKEVKVTSNIAQELIGSSQNPIMTLIEILSRAVHPGLGAEAARISLGYLLSCQMDQPGISEYKKAVELAWQAVEEKSRKMIHGEEVYLESKTKDLIASITKRISAKLALFESLKIKRAPPEEQTLSVNNNTV